MFYPANTASVDGDTVKLTGTLVSWIDNKITNNKKITLSVTYSINNGMAYIVRWKDV